MAERYERQGDYAHAARLYEELLKGDPSRTQVRNRLQALAVHGVVSPQAQGVLADNVGEIVAEHQRQLAEIESQREIDRHLASMTPIPTPDGYQLVDTSVARGVARIQSPVVSEPWAPETVAVTTEVPEPTTTESQFERIGDELQSSPSEHSALHSTTESTPEVSIPTPVDEVPAGPDNWHQTVIRPQEEARRPTVASADTESNEDSATESHAPLSRVVSSGSRLWHAVNEPAIAASQNIQPDSPEIAELATADSSEWANAASLSTASTTEMPSLASSSRQESAWRIPAAHAADESLTDSVADPFCDPIVSGETVSSESTSDEAAGTEPTPIGSWIDTTQPLQRAQSAFTLWQVSGSAERTVPALIELLEHDDQQVVEVACYFLGELGPAANLATAPLETICENADETTSILAAEALSKIAPSEPESVEHIVQMVQSGDHESRLLATMTLGGVDHQHESLVVPVLATLLNDQHPQIRSAAALSLGGWGPAAANCSTKLEELALADVPEVSEAARIALECIEK